MNATKVSHAICVLVFSSAAATASTSPLATLKSMTLGMGLPAFQKAEPAAKCVVDSAVRMRCQLQTTVAQAPARISLEFVSSGELAAPLKPQYEKVPEKTAAEIRNFGSDVTPAAKEIQARNTAKARSYEAAVGQFQEQFKLAAILVVFNSDSFTAFKEAYTTKAGQPLSSENAVYRNAFSAEFNGSNSYWADSIARATLLQRCDKVTDSCLVVELLSLKAKRAQADLLDKAARAKDL